MKKKNNEIYSEMLFKNICFESNTKKYIIDEKKKI